MDEACVELRPTAPYSVPLALSYLASSPSSVLEEVDRDSGTCTRALRVNGVDLLLTLRDTGTLDDPRIDVVVRGGNLTPGLIDKATRAVRRIFQLDTDPEPFFSMAQKDAVLGPLIAELPGVRPFLVADPYEALIFAIVGQQVNIAFARRMKLALVERFGSHIELGDVEVLLLPDPERIAALDPSELLALQFSGQKASYLIELSSSIAAGDLDLTAIGTLPLEDAVSELTRYRGVGRWTAEYVLMRGLGFQDCLPAGDLGLRKIIGLAYGLNRTANEAEVRQIAERWTGWRGWAAFIWWLELQTNGLSRFAE